MNQNPALLPDEVAAAALQAAEILFSALSPAWVRDPESPGLSALWDITKVLNALSGSLDGFRDIPEAELPGPSCTRRCSRPRASPTAR